MVTECRMIDLSGSPKSRGEQHGAAAEVEIREGVAQYLSRMAETGLGERQMADLTEAYLPAIDRFDATYVNEMQGIAEGAGVPLSHILLLNARTELLKMAGNPALRQSLEAERGADGCTTIVVQPERAAEGELIHAHNWDWKASCETTCVVLRIRNDDGPDILTFTEAGGLARFGFNSAGISITGNYLECERDYRRMGVPLALIRRKVLQQDNPALAFGAAYNTAKSASNNLAIAHAPTGVVHDLECAPDETFVVEPDNGVLVHSNHWLSPIALSKFRETGIADSPCSHFREQRARRLLAPIEKVGVADLKRVLNDDAGSPLSICVPPRPSNVTGFTATVASLIMRPQSGSMEVAMMPALGGRFRTYSIDARVDTKQGADA